MNEREFSAPSDILANEFRVTYAKLIVRNNPSGWHASVDEKDDCPMDYAIVNEHDQAIYKGSVLMRNGKVHFYDRYPMGGGPFKISDFKDEEFRKRCELIATSIESIVK